MTPESERYRAELELDRNRFLLIRRLIERGDIKGAASTTDVAIIRLSKTLDPRPGEHAPS
jgi:hypothetical protein